MTEETLYRSRLFAKPWRILIVERGGTRQLRKEREADGTCFESESTWRIVSLVSQRACYLPLSCLSMSMSMSLVGSSLITREIFEDHSIKDRVQTRTCILLPAPNADEESTEDYSATYRDDFRRSADSYSFSLQTIDSLDGNALKVPITILP